MHCRRASALSHVLGGQCVISTTLDPEGRIVHLGDAHTLTFGEWTGPLGAHRGDRQRILRRSLRGASEQWILQEMWEKWVFIAASAGITCLMRATIGDIVAAGAADLAAMLFAECAAIAAREGFAPRPAFAERTRTMLTAPGSPDDGLDAARHRARRAGRGRPHPRRSARRAASTDGSLLRIAYAHAKAYEARRARDRAAVAGAA